MMSGPQFTLSQAGRLLEEPQHRLIYLCEKRVVVPDFGEARGRGSSRRFSVRNLLEFAVALKFRELMIPVSAIGTVLYVLREFEKRVRQDIPEFVLPESLCEPDSPELRVIITDGLQLFFLLAPKNGVEKVFGGIGLTRLPTPTAKSGDAVGKESTGRQTISARGKRMSLENFSQFPDAIEAFGAKLELNISRIARRLQLKE